MQAMNLHNHMERTAGHVTSSPQVSKIFTAACHKAGPTGVLMSDGKIESTTSVKQRTVQPPKIDK